jgi:hypothetical protein
MFSQSALVGVKTGKRVSGTLNTISQFMHTISHLRGKGVRYPFFSQVPFFSGSCRRRDHDWSPAHKFPEIADAVVTPATVASHDRKLDNKPYYTSSK